VIIDNINQFLILFNFITRLWSWWNLLLLVRQFRERLTISVLLQDCDCRRISFFLFFLRFREKSSFFICFLWLRSLFSCFFHVSEKSRLFLFVFFLTQKLSKKKKSWIDRSISRKRDQWQQYHKFAAISRCRVVMKIFFKNQKNHRKLKKYQSWIWSFQNWKNSRLVRRLKAHFSLDYTRKKKSLRIILQRTKIEK
jgi:hypothetical protein